MVTSAVIFDNDGVLVDSLDLHWLAYCEAIGKGVDKMEILLREGMTAGGIIHEITGAEGSRLDRMVRGKMDAFARIRGELKPLPKAVEVVSKVRESDMKVAMETGTSRHNIDAWFGKREGLFDAIVAAEGSPKAKPDPEPYLLAAEKLGVEPENCVVVENAPLGVEAAKAAGMRCIAITSTLPASYLKEADVVIDDIGDVLKWI